MSRNEVLFHKDLRKIPLKSSIYPKHPILSPIDWTGKASIKLFLAYSMKLLKNYNETELFFS